jgi:5-methylcytosine-specific restriction endonuclease McrA
MKCLQCFKPLTGYQKKFCSNSCCATHSNLTTPRRTKTSPLWHDCPACGKQTRNIRYCSNECKPKLTSEERYAKNRAIKNEAWQRYMAKRKNQTPDNVDINLLQQFYLNCPEGHEVDHKIPISKGGLHCLENLQYLTVSENRKKSNKL